MTVVTEIELAFSHVWQLL